MLEIHGLTKAYRDLVAIDNLSFTVQTGEVVGFLGSNGAGKSTTMRILTGALPATRGTARVAGFDVFEQPRQVKENLGYLPEIPPVYPDLTVEEYLTFVSRLKGFRKEKIKSCVEEALERVNLKDVRRRLIGNLSKGFQQRTGLAQALLGRPQVLILDEPTVGLDPRQIGDVRELIRSLAGEHTVLLSTHILQEVTAICERVIVINKGRIVADDNLGHLVESFKNQGRALSLEQIFLSLTEG